MSPSKRDRRRKPDPTTPTEPSDGGQGSTNNPYRTPPSQPATCCDCDQIICLLDKIARTTCLTANEVHRQGKTLESIAASMQAFVEMYQIGRASCRERVCSVV